MSTVPLHPVARLPIVAEAGPSALAGASSRGSHRLAAVNTCPLAWYLRYILYLRPIAEPSYRMLGTLIHVALAYWYASQLEEAPNWFHELDLKTKLRLIAPNQPKLVQRALDVLADYMTAEEVLSSDRLLKTVWIETEFKARIGELDPGGPSPELDDEWVTARLDRVVEDTDGCLWIMDYKCSGWSRRKDGKLDSWKDQGEFVIDWQVLLGLAILRQRVKNRIVKGFMIRRIKREPPFDYDTVPLEIPERPYRRVGRMARAQVAAENHWLARAGTARSIGELLGGDVLPEHYWACKGTRYGPCDYRRLCAAREAQRAHTMKMFYVVLKEVFDDDDESYAD